MAITFPRTGEIKVNQLSFYLQPMLETATTRGGGRTAISMGTTKWRGRFETPPLEAADFGTHKAFLATLLEGETFYTYDQYRKYPLAHPEGFAGFDGEAELGIVTDNKLVNLTGLPEGFELSAGDYIAFDYGSEVKRALHLVVAGDVAENGLSVSNTASAFDNTNLTSYSFASQSFGAANTARQIFVVIHASGSSVSGITAVTIGGVAASIVATDTGASNSYMVIARAYVPSGTSGTVAFTATGGAARGAISVYRVIGAGVHVTAAGVAASPDYSLTIPVPARGAVIAGAAATSAVSWTWTGLSEDTDLETESPIFSTASGTFTNANPSLAVTATASGSVGSTNRAMVAVSLWGCVADVEVRPHVRTGGTPPRTVYLYQPSAEMQLLPGTYQESVDVDGFGKISFEAEQRL